MSKTEKPIKNGTVIRKAYTIADSFFINGRTFYYADSLAEAKAMTDPELRNKLIRSKQHDKLNYNGDVLARWMYKQVIQEDKRVKSLEKLMKTSKAKYFYIMKGISLYRLNSCGYTQQRFEAGVYSKEEAVKHALRCHELHLIPIDIVEHNNMIQKVISDLQSRIINTSI
jgi:hypothetical protein